MDKNLIFIIGAILLFVLFIVFAVFIYYRNKNNGSTLTQQFVGKKFGELCSSNAMCGSNKCINNLCVL